MTDHTPSASNPQQSLIDEATTRTLLDQLIQDSRLYKSTKDYQALLDFVVRLRNFGPFNALLLQIQKPGLTYAASAMEWREKFERYPKESARPLVILWPFGPVAFVYDVLDTDGKPLPKDAFCFVAHGATSEEDLQAYAHRLGRKSIDVIAVDEGDGSAGRIRVVKRAKNDKETSEYRIAVNRNHTPAVRLATLAHELGHLALGHLGVDQKLGVSHRNTGTDKQREIEAESVAYLVCMRHGVKPKSETYLADYVAKNMTIEHLDVYQVMRAAGLVENLLGIAERAQFESPRSAKRTPSNGAVQLQLGIPEPPDTLERPAEAEA